MARDNRLRIDKIEITASEEELTGHGGLLPVVEFLVKKGMVKLINKRLPSPGSGNGYSAAEFLITLWVNVLVFGKEATLSTIDDLGMNKATLRMLKMKKMPSSSAAGDFLRRMANREAHKEDGEWVYSGYADGMTRMQNLFCETTVLVLKKMAGDAAGMLDYDAIALSENKRYNRTMYNGEKGTMGYFAFFERVCVMAELEPGNHSPNDRIARRIMSCIKLCEKAGVRVKALRSDAAGYVAAVINYCMKNKLLFYIRASLDCAVRASVKTIKEEIWRVTGIRQAGKKAKREVSVGRCVHTMNDTKKAFSLVVHRVKKEEEVKEELGMMVRRVSHTHWAVATNDDERGEEEIIEIYNARGNESENRNKEIAIDARIERFPCGGDYGLEANRIYCYVNAMLYNLMELYKYECLGRKEQPMRLPSLRRKYIAIPAKVTLHARALSVSLANYAYHTADWLNELVRVIRRRARQFPIPRTAPVLAPFIYRRSPPHIRIAAQGCLCFHMRV